MSARIAQCSDYATRWTTGGSSLDYRRLDRLWSRLIHLFNGCLQ